MNGTQELVVTHGASLVSWADIAVIGSLSLLLLMLSLLVGAVAVGVWRHTWP